ncbi:MAG: hypothetical protein IAF38_03950 [Bacteroidia bacterium]|nr:hypothetical protein [Bacteroidia bacterium]
MATLKMNLHKLVDKSNNCSLLKVVYQLLSTEEKKSNGYDWFDSLSETQKTEVERSLREFEEGKEIPHSKVMAKYKGKYC